MYTWTNQCDPEIYEHGEVVMICAIPNKRCDEFIEKLSNDIGCKLDYNNAAGRNVIRCKAEEYIKVADYIRILRDSGSSIFCDYGMNESGYLLYLEGVVQ